MAPAIRTFSATMEPSRTTAASTCCGTESLAIKRYPPQRSKIMTQTIAAAISQRSARKLDLVGVGIPMSFAIPMQAGYCTAKGIDRKRPDSSMCPDGYLDIDWALCQPETNLRHPQIG